jgi:ABC-type Zn uptake system ZnuABC Zn-binding protein ZnuA
MGKTVSGLLAALAVLSLFAVGGCRSEPTPEREHERNQDGLLALPELEAADLDGAPLQVVATTSIIGDVVAQVGRDAIELTTLMGPGQDPHSYQPTPQNMATVSQAHVVFVNGWDLEEALVHDLEDIAKDVPIVPVSANIEPLAFGEAGSSTHGHENVDPHTWFSVPNVEQWVENIRQVLSELDPAHAETYGEHAKAYLAELQELQAYAASQLATIPAAKRFLVTNHDTFGYLAHEYDLEVLGTVLPAASTLADPSASDLTDLIDKIKDHGVCTLFTETTVSDKLAQTVAAELDGCPQVRVLKLYTGAVGPAGSGAESYIGMFRYNVDAIVNGLK